MSQSLVIIPARAGSKRLPNKNIKMLLGKPLLAYTIDAVKNSQHVNRFIVSTENQEIATISTTYGAEVLIRPRELAQDESSTEDVVFNVLDQLQQKEQYTPDVIILLQPTSPLRTTEDINSALTMFLTSSGDSLISVTEFDHTPYWAFRIEKGFLKSEFTQDKLKRSQESPKLYRPNGSIFIIRTQTFLKNRSFYTNHSIPYIMPRERSIDIDDEFDFSMAEILLKKSEGKKWDR